MAKRGDNATGARLPSGFGCRYQVERGGNREDCGDLADASGYCAGHARVVEHRDAMLAKANAEARRWLEARGLWDENPAERFRKQRAFRDSLKTTSRPHPRAWAGEILRRIEDGEKFPSVCERLALSVVGQPEDDVDALAV